MEINKEVLADLSMRLPYGVKGYVPLEVFNGSYDLIDGSAEYDEVDVLVELVGINADNGDIEVICLDDKYDLSNDDYYTINDFKPILHPMESLPDDERQKMLDVMYDLTMQNLQEKVNGNDTLNPDSYSYCIKFLIERHYDVNHLIPKKLAVAVTEENDPYSEN